MLTLLTLLPIVGALIVLALGKNLARATAFVFSFASLALTLVVWFRFDPTSPASSSRKSIPGSRSPPSTSTTTSASTASAS